MSAIHELEERERELKRRPEKWGDAKKYLFEDIVIFGGLLFILLFDFAVNGLLHFGFNVAPHEPAGHPYSLGAIQTLGITFICLIQAARRVSDWRYYH